MQNDERPPSPWASARNILAVRLDNMGDVLMTTPALRALRQSLAGRRITLLTSPAGAAVAPFVPEIDHLLVVATPWVAGGPSRPGLLAAAADLLHRRQYDAAVIFTVYSQNPLPAAFLCWLAGIPLILAHCRENPYQLLSDWVPDPEPQEILRHEVRRQLDLVASVGAHTNDKTLSFRLRPEDQRQAHLKLLAAGGIPGRPFLVLHPGASAAARRYPPGHFALLAELLGEMADYQLVMTGDENECALVDSIRAEVSQPLISLAGRLTLGELAALIDEAALLIANNSGPVHIAAAVGTPVVDIYALTNPQHPPWQVPHRVLYQDVPCRFCYRGTCPQGHHACLRLLDPEKVARAARQLLDECADRVATR